MFGMFMIAFKHYRKKVVLIILSNAKDFKQQLKKTTGYEVQDYRTKCDHRLQFLKGMGKICKEVGLSICVRNRSVCLDVWKN